jgi:malonyl-CoA O-methyltransferase
VIAIDLSTAMLQAARRRQSFWRRRFARVAARAEQLPLADASADLLFSSLMLQWCEDPLPVFAEARRVLRPGGVLLVSTFAPATLRELRAAWSKADDGPHVSDFAHPAQVADALGLAGLQEGVVDVDLYTRHYADAHALMRELQDIGAGNAASNRSRGLTGKGRLQLMLAAYESMREASGLPATFEVIFASAFAGRARSRSADGEFTLAADAIGRASARIR